MLLPLPVIVVRTTIGALFPTFTDKPLNASGSYLSGINVEQKKMEAAHVI